MTSECRPSVSIRLLLGLVLLLWSAPAAAQLATPTDSAAPSATQAAPDSAASSTLPPGHRSSDFRISINSESGDGVDSFPEFIAFMILILLLTAVAGAFAGGFAAVSIFMDTGCLRMLVATLGWGVAVIAGLVVGVLMGTGFGGLQAFTIIGLFGGGLLYIAAWQRGHKRAQQLPEADRLTWKRTLTGGALFGTGAGSVANLARSAGALFKGGGGSFGGGGASGSFGGAQAAASAKGAAVKSAAAPGAVTLGATGASGSSSEEAPVKKSDARAEPASAPPSAKTPASSSVPRRHSWMDAVAEQWDRLRWYHAMAFVFIGLIFLPVGIGAAALLQNGTLFLGTTLVGLSVWSYVRLVINQHMDFFTAGILVLVPLVMASVWLARHSQAPYWHLGIVLTVVLAVALYRSNVRNAPSPDETDEAAAFDGGGASSRW